MIYYKSSIKMEEVSDESVHLVITSPPYPMIEKWDKLFESQISHFKASHIDPESSILESACWLDEVLDTKVFIYSLQLELLRKVFKESYKKIINGGILCINIGDATRKFNGEFQCFPNFSKVVTLCSKIGFTPLIPIFWKKISKRPNAFLGSGFLPVNAYVSQDCEYIAIFRKGKLRQFSDEEKERRKQSTFTKQERDKWFSQIWNIPGKKGAGKTSSWPDEIPYRLIRMFSIIGDTVLDPFCGTGDEELCNSLGRNYIGYTLPEENS